VPGADLDQVLRLKRAGDLDAAVIALEGVLEGSPRHPAGYAQLADIQLRRGRYDEAQGALDRAEAEAGTTAFTARLRGDLAYRTGRYADAARSYRDAEALGDRGTWALVQLGRSLLRLGDLDGARGAAARAVERDDAASAAWVLLGDVELRQDRLVSPSAVEAKESSKSAHSWCRGSSTSAAPKMTPVSMTITVAIFRRLRRSCRRSGRG
jgi:tetratricopeptide (TPR) repeat protein